jgi:hypothetical protein
MSNVVSPRGPLPPRVYWRRRLVLLAVLVGVVVLVGQLLSGGDETQPVAERGPAEPTAPAAKEPANPAREEQAAGDRAGDERAARQRAARRREAAREARAAEPPVSLSGAASPLAQPAGPCAVSEVAIVPDVEDTDAGSTVPLRLGLSTSGRQACTFAFGPDTVAVRVTSGDDLIWETLQCGRAIEEQSVVVRPGWLTYVTVPWTGRRDDEGCALTGDFASPGYYWAEAAAVGGEPQRSQFQLETPPPPPKPEPKPKRADERRGDDTTGEQRDRGDAREEGSDAAARGTDQAAPEEGTRQQEDRRPQTRQQTRQQDEQQQDEDGDGTRLDRRRDGQT